MKVIALYHPESDHARSLITFQDEFLKRTTQKVDLISLETVEGSQMARVYDITSYPAILVTTDDGQLQALWQGEQLPLMNEVSGYIVSH